LDPHLSRCAGVPEAGRSSREAFALAAAKLPVGTRFVMRPGEEIS
jgi:ribosomal protein L16/L10AE